MKREKKRKNFHVLNVFNFYSLYHYLHFSCEFCKKYDECKKIMPIQDSCLAASDVEKKMDKIIVGKTNEFHTACYYIKPGSRRTGNEIMQTITDFLNKKYQR